MVQRELRVRQIASELEYLSGEDGLVGAELDERLAVRRADKHQLAGLVSVRAELDLRHQVAEVGGVETAA